MIADNATFHKGGQIQELIEAAGCQLKYLPSYSPDREQNRALLVMVKEPNS